MFRKFLLAGVLCAATTLTASSAQAGVSGLFNTGTTSGMDNHYIFGTGVNETTAVGNVSTSTTKAYTIDPLPYGSYLPNSAISKWISDTPTGVNSTPSPLYYAFQTNFNVTGNTSGIAIKGKWLTDNEGFDILLNGAKIVPGPTTGNPTGGNFTDWTNFQINSGFVIGVNKLEFVVHNQEQKDGNPVGLRVEMTAVPEPAYVQMSALLLGGGLLGLRHRKRQKAA